MVATLTYETWYAAHSVMTTLTFSPPLGWKDAGLNVIVVSVQWRGRGRGGVADEGEVVMGVSLGSCANHSR